MWIHGSQLIPFLPCAEQFQRIKRLLKKTAQGEEVEETSNDGRAGIPSKPPIAISHLLENDKEDRPPRLYMFNKIALQ